METSTAKFQQYRKSLNSILKSFCVHYRQCFSTGVPQGVSKGPARYADYVFSKLFLILVLYSLLLGKSLFCNTFLCPVNTVYISKYSMCIVSARGTQGVNLLTILGKRSAELVTLCVQSLGAERLRNNDPQDKCRNKRQHMNFLSSLNFPTRTPAAEGTATIYRTQVTTTRLSWSHVFLGASVKHSSCFSRSCETLMQPQEAITAGTVCLC